MMTTIRAALRYSLLGLTRALGLATAAQAAITVSIAEIAGGRLVVTGTITGSAPAGEITAGNLLLRADSGEDAGYTLVFGGGVRLIYQP